MDISIDPCSRADALRIFQDPSVYKPWGVLLDDVPDTSTLYLVNNKVLLQLIPDGEEVRVHMACPFRDRAGIREILLKAIQWLKSLGFVRIATTAPADRKALHHLLSSLGFNHIDERWVWELKQL